MVGEWSEREEGTKSGTAFSLEEGLGFCSECSGAHGWVLSGGWPDLTFPETAAVCALILYKETAQESTALVY